MPLICDRLKTLNFPSLLIKPNRSTFATQSKVVSILQKLPFKGDLIDSIVAIARLGGLYSSEGIERWVEGCLKELTGKHNAPVSFSELVMPLHVVAGDLSMMKARVWSDRATPTQSVAHAVRASCSIPLYFQPVEEGSALLVDGGIVSNIPHFVFTGETAQNTKKRNRILLFMLEATEERKRADDARELAEQLVSLAIDGGTDIQLSFTPDIARILIPTGKIRATTLRKCDTKGGGAGRKRSRCRGQIHQWRTVKHSGERSRKLSISDEHEAYLAIAEQLYSTKSEVRVAIPDTKWFWELFPTVLHWRKTNIRVVTFVAPVVPDSPDAPKEIQRRDFMKGMGVELVELHHCLLGILFDSVASSGAAALTFPGERSDYEPAGRFYSGRIDHAALAALHDRLPLPNVHGGNSQHSPQLQSADSEALLTRLQRTSNSIGNRASRSQSKTWM